jgi:hypothetical protein
MGSLFEYFRNEATDANDWFNNYNGISKRALRYQDFGGSLGGAFNLPHLYRGRDRTFFFFSFEEVLLKQPRGAIQTLVPTSTTRDNAPPDLAPLLNASPLPNRPSGILQASNPGFDLFVGNGWLRQNQQTYGLRMDHYFSDAIAMFARYNQSPSVSNDRPFTNLANTQFYSISTKTLTLGLTQTIRPTLVHEARWNASSQAVVVRNGIDDYGGAKPPPDSALFPAGYSGRNSSTNISSLNQGFFSGLASDTQGRQLQWVESLSWVKGTHQFKFGADLVWFSPVDRPPQLNSTAVFGGSIYTNAKYTDVPALVFESRSNGNVAYSIPSFSIYAQDMWRPGRKLTVTYGVRWEINPAPGVMSGQASFLTQLTTLQDFTSVSALAPGESLYPTQYSHFAPRVGLAWQLFSGPAWRTTLRAGAGVFYDTSQNGFTQRAAEPQNYLVYGNTPFGTRPAASDILEGYTAFTYQIAAAPNYTLPRTYEWNVTLEQAVGAQTFSAAYVGAAGHNLNATLQSPSESGNSVYVLTSRFRSNFQSLQVRFDRQLARGVQALVSYTWAHSIDNLSNDAIDTGLDAYFHPDSNRGSSDFDIRHSLNGAILWALPAPRGRLSSALFRDWNANVIFIDHSALPVDIAVKKTADSELILRPDLVPGQPFYLYGSGYPGGKRLNPAAFAVPAANAAQGTLGRNVVRAFGIWQADLALERRFALTERVGLLLRADAFNILNHPSFASPTNFVNSPQTTYLGSNPTKFGYSSASFGSLLGFQNVQGQLNPAFQIGQSRSLQFSLHLRF